MAFTARLKPELEAEARQLAESMGISLMALVSVALAEYVGSRRQRSGAPLPSIATPSGAGSLPEATSAPAKPGKGPKPPPPPKVKHRSGAALMRKERGVVYGPHLDRCSPDSDSPPDGEGFD